MKKRIKIIASIVCILLGMVILYEAIKSLFYSDPWGLGFIFVTLPMLLFAMLFLLEGYYLVKSLKDNKQEKERR